MSEPRYTLTEARLEMAKRACAAHGHDWNIIGSLSDGPVRIVCDSCGWAGEVKMGPRHDESPPTDPRVDEGR